MSVTIVLLALASALFTAFGQLAFKFYTESGGSLNPASMFRNRNIILGTLCYGAYFGALIVAYRLGGEISVVFPLTAVAYLVTPILGRLVLKERFGWRVPAGAVLIISGCVLLG